MTMALHPTLDAVLSDFYNEAVTQATELKAALLLHQARMKKVCHSIKAHNYWVRNSIYNRRCELCENYISPEFDMRRHRGLCILLTLHGILPLRGIFLDFPPIPIGFLKPCYLPVSRDS